jgi:hypothetical protein
MALEMDYDHVTLLLRLTEELLRTQHMRRRWFRQHYDTLSALLHIAKQHDIDTETIKIAIDELITIANRHGFGSIINPLTTQTAIIDIFHEAVVEREKFYGPLV